MNRDRSALVDLGPSALAPAGRTSAPTRRHGWERGYARRLAVTDFTAILVAMVTAYLVRFDPTGPLPAVTGTFNPPYLACCAALVVAWFCALTFGRTRDKRLLGAGAAEYARVFAVSWRLFAAVAVTAYLAKMDIARGYLAIAFPLGVGLLLLSRFGWRQWLHARRARGFCSSSLLVIGHRETAEQLIRELAGRSDAGYVVVGVCVPSSDAIAGETVLGVPVVGGLNDVAALAVAVGADTVAVTGSDKITAAVVRRLGWDLEPTGIDLVLAPALTDVAGPRIVVSPVNGLPLMHVDAPAFTGPKYVLKTAFEWVTAALLLVVLAPLLIAVAVLVKFTSAGPVLYRQERIGRNGKSFRMVKFRSMTANAHERLEEVMGDVTLFYKRPDDPRVTRLGRVLRRYSLDELPQLFNVLRGDMSLVGPRPQIDQEVAQYDRTANRRLLVKPGVTGLWQVSGRSELSPDEAIRMDVYYVENWTLFGDLLILARTAKVMIGGEGAY